MTRITLDVTALETLSQVTQCIEICKPDGSIVGYFAPAVDRSLYEPNEPPISDEELRSREQELGGRTLSEILADLEKRG